MSVIDRFAACLAFGLSLAAPVVAQPGPSLQYSADYSIETAEGAVAGHVNVMPGMERRETLTDGTTTVIIRRDDKGTMWMLMPAERMYMEMKPGQLPPGKSQAADVGAYQTEFTDVGMETLNGQQTMKKKAVMTGKDGSKMAGFWWMTTQGLVVKIDVIAVEQGKKERMKSELTNIQIGPQDAALFEIPAGYTAMSGMGGLSTLMQGSGSDAQAAPADQAEGDDAAEAEPPKKKGFGWRDALDMIN